MAKKKPLRTYECAKIVCTIEANARKRIAWQICLGFLFFGSQFSSFFFVATFPQLFSIFFLCYIGFLLFFPFYILFEKHIHIYNTNTTYARVLYNFKLDSGLLFFFLLFLCAVWYKTISTIKVINNLFVVNINLNNRLYCRPLSAILVYRQQHTIQFKHTHTHTIAEKKEKEHF